MKYLIPELVVSTQNGVYVAKDVLEIEDKRWNEKLESVLRLLLKLCSLQDIHANSRYVVAS